MRFDVDEKGMRISESVPQKENSHEPAQRPAERRNGAVTMNDLRTILGDKYDDTIEKARHAIEDELIELRDRGILVLNNNGLTVNDRDGSHNGIRRMSTAMGVHTALAAVLPDLLAEANTRAEDAEAKARRFANLLGNNAKALNDVLPREVLRQKAEAWDEALVGVVSGALAGTEGPAHHWDDDARRVLDALAARGYYLDRPKAGA